MKIVRHLIFAGVFAATAFGQGTPTAALTSADNTATVHFYRYKQYVGSALRPSVYIDDVPLARMANGREYTIQVPAGQHTIRSEDKQSGVQVNLEAGKSYYFRIEEQTGFWKGHGRLVAVLPEQGQFEVGKLKPLQDEWIMKKTWNGPVLNQK